MHGDGTYFGSVHRVEGFDQWPDDVDLAGVVGVMNRAATEDVSSTVWPVIRGVLGDDAPSELSAAAADLLDEWVADDAPRLDADDDGNNDSAGPTVFDEVLDAVYFAITDPVLGAELAESRVGIDDVSLIDKDLRTVLGEDVEGPFATSFCGAGDIDTCRADLWAAVDGALTQIAAERGDDPTTWLNEGARVTFVPGLIEDDFRFTNRPTFQQVIEFAPGG
jgi:hypothetical protein